MKKQYVYITTSLLTSLFIYLFYRTDKTLVNELAIRLFSYKTYASWKAGISNFLPLNKTAIYSLPEGLWVFCITLTSKPYYIGWKHRRIMCVYLPLVFSVSLELLQLLHVTNGRFDLMDIALSFIFWLMGACIVRDKVRHNLIGPLNAKAIVCLASYCIVYLAHVFK